MTANPSPLTPHVSVIGVGYWGKNLVRNFHQLGVLKTIYDLLRRFHDPDPAKTRYFKVWGNHDEDWRDNPAPLRTLFPAIQINGDILGRGKMRD